MWQALSTDTEGVPHVDFSLYPYFIVVTYARYQLLLVPHEIVNIVYLFGSLLLLLCVSYLYSLIAIYIYMLVR